MTKRAKLILAAKYANVPIVDRLYTGGGFDSATCARVPVVSTRGVYARCLIYSDGRMFGMVRTKYDGAARELSPRQVARLRQALAHLFGVPVSAVRTYPFNSDLCVFHEAPPSAAQRARARGAVTGTRADRISDNAARAHDARSGWE